MSDTSVVEVLGRPVQAPLDVVVDAPASVIERKNGSYRARKHGAHVPALMESNLARKGVWALSPDRSQTASKVDDDVDILGACRLVYGQLGQLGDYELRLVAWVLGRWRPGVRSIRFSQRACVRDFGAPEWGGSRGECLVEALERIAGTRIEGRFYNTVTRNRRDMVVSIFDVVSDGKAASLDGPRIGDASVEVILSGWLLQQLEGNHFTRLNFETLHHRLTTPLARRLYAFLEAEQGYVGGTLWQRTIDSALMSSLGLSDPNMSRVRKKLITAGEAICREDSRYHEIGIRRGAERNAWILVVRRDGVRN